MRLLVATAITVIVAFATYGAAATVIFSSAVDPDVTCDPDGVTIAGWSLSPSLGEVTAVALTEIDPSCVGAELYVQALQEGAALADGSFIVSGDHIGGNVAAVSFTALGSSDAPVSVGADTVTAVSVLLHRGSGPATGPEDLPCELLGMSIESWGVDLVSSLVSSLSVVDVNPDCIGFDLVLAVYAGDDVIADGRVLLTAANTGSDVLTIPFSAPGAANTANPVLASEVTGIEIRVEGEVEDELPAPPTGDAPPAIVTGPRSSDLVAEVQTNQIIATPGETTRQPELTNEVQGIRRLPSTGSGGLLGGNAGKAAPVFAALIAGLVAGTLGFAALRRSKTR